MTKRLYFTLGVGLAIATAAAFATPVFKSSPNTYALSNEGTYTGQTNIKLQDPTRVAAVWTSASKETWNGPLLIGLRSRGTIEAPEPAQEGDNSLYFAGSIWDGHGWERLGYLGWQVAGPVVPGKTPGRLVARITPPGHYMPVDIMAQDTGGGLWTRQQGPDRVVTLNDAPTIAWDVAPAQVAQLTLGGDRELQAPQNAREGHTYRLWVKDDGRTRMLSFAAGYHLSDGTDPLVLNAGERGLLTFAFHDGVMFGTLTRFKPAMRRDQRP